MNRRKAKHDRRRAHQREQAQRKQNALRESYHEAANLGKDGRQLKRPRTGKALESALLEAMNKRGYELIARARTVRLAPHLREQGRSGKMSKPGEPGTYKSPKVTTEVSELIWVRMRRSEGQAAA